MTINAQQIRAEAHLTVGKLIQRDASIIIERWSRRVLQEQPRALRVHHEALLDHLPSFLHDVGECLAENQDWEPDKHWSNARQHGEQRWQNGWSLAEVIQDYQILRFVVVDYLEETMDRHLRAREIMAIGLALDEAITASVNAYTAASQERADRTDRAVQHHAELLKATNRRKDEFLAILGHEMRNPLGPIRNAVEVLALRGNDQSTVEWVRGMLARQVRIMTRLVDDLLDASRVGRGKIILQKERLDLVRLVATVTEDMQAATTSTGPPITVELPTGPVWVDGDVTRLTQIIGNLLQNAAKFTDRSGRVTVRLEHQEKAPRATLSVRDTGIGIEPDLLGKVFDSFMQADRTVERSRGGLGLGLALVRGLVELHGGSVTAASEGVGKGAEFLVELPVATELGVAVAKSPTGAGVGRPSRILLIEDNRDSAHCLKLLLELAGHKVTVAYSGAEGVKAASQNKPDVVLSDLGLPGMSGYEVAQALRAEPTTSRIVLIAISGYGSDTDLAHCRQAGFDHHLTKPVDLTLLNDLLVKLLPEPT